MSTLMTWIDAGVRSMGSCRWVETRRVLLALVVALFAGACSSSSAATDEPLADGVLQLGVLPDDEPDALEARYRPLADHLQYELGVDVTLVVPSSYADLTDEFARRSVDIAVFGAVSFLLAQDESGAEPLAMRDIDARFFTAFIARADEEGVAVSDFGGRRLAFGSDLSTSGHLMPRFFLGEVFAMEPEVDFSDVIYTGTHDATVAAVLDGSADLGAVNKQVFDDMLRTGRLSADDLRVVWITPPYVDYVWAVQPALEEAVRTDILNTLLQLTASTPVGQEILTPLGGRGFIPATPEDFAQLRKIANEVGILENA